MISPAFLTIMLSPMFISFSLMKSSLWSTALETVVPAKEIGSKIATGVKTPVLPTLISISISVVSFSSGGYL